MSYPSFEDECGANAPWWQLPFVALFWIVLLLISIPLKLIIDFFYPMPKEQPWDGVERRREIHVQ